MASFQDNQSRRWTVEIDTTVVKDVRGAFDINLLDISTDDSSVWVRLFGDLIVFVDVLWFLCRAQAEREGIDEREFAKGLRGDVLGAAANAVVESITDFFPDPKRREALRALAKKGAAVTESLMQMSLEELEAVDADQAARSFIGSASSSRPSPE